MATKTFLYFSLFYLALAVMVVLLFRHEGLTLAVGAIGNNVGFLTTVYQFAIAYVLGLFVLIKFVGLDVMRLRLRLIVQTFFSVVIFNTAFTLVKTSLPFLIPFYADPYFADIDNFLHFGIDPYRIVHAIDEILQINSLFFLYSTTWLVPALFFPVLVVTFDDDTQRIERYFILYITAWVFIGNIAALIGMSAGSVFHDRIYGGDRFADLSDVLFLSGVSADLIGKIQAFLWEVYQNHGQAAGSGISAFPSVHVAMAMVMALYLFDRSRILGGLGISFTILTLFLSVYTGYHYAIDGYVSIIVIFATWRFLNRRFKNTLKSD